MSAPPPPPTKDSHRKSLGRYVKRMSSVFKRDKPAAADPHAAPAAATAATAAEANIEQEQAPRPQAAQPSDDTYIPHVSSAHVKQATTDAAAGTAAADSATSASPDAPKDDAGNVEIAKWRAYRAEVDRNKAASSALAATEPTATEPTATEDLTPATTVQQPPAPIAMTAVDRNVLQQERARALFAKYGLSLESHEWIATSTTGPPVPRVDKAIRMRVHRSCHRCGTFYGHDRVCQQCEHKRCKKCPRYPKKKSASTGKEADADDKPPKKRILTITARSGNELVYQPPKQRIKRACHKCEAPFVPPTATACKECQHVRCTKCPRDPAKRNKWADGYPGDAEANSDSEVEKQRDSFRRIWRKQRRIVRWECELCNTMFRNGSPMCPGCGHERCDQCTRSPVEKPNVEESFDPEVVASVEAKLRALGVNDDPPTLEPESEPTSEPQAT